MAAIAIALTFVPLFNLLGFEFSVALGAVLAYVAGWRACRSAWDARESWMPLHDDLHGERFPAAALLRIAGTNLLLCFLPLAIIAANSMRVPTCNWNEGLQFYALFTLPGILYGTTLGYALGLRFAPRIARTLFVLWSIATYVWALGNVVFEPPIFAYNAFIGFFPGPVYDRLIPVSTTLLLARAIVVAEAMLFVQIATLLWDGQRLSFRALMFPWNGTRGTVGSMAVITLISVVFLMSQSAALGMRIDRRTIQRQLGGSIETEHCDIYYDVTAYTPERADELAREHEFHYSELREFFGFVPQARVGSYVYASPQQKKRLMGAAGTNFEDALNDEFHINASRYPHPVLRHEMAHIFAAHLSRWWPICPLIGVHEGIAVAADWRGESMRLGMTPDEACVAMDSLGVLPDLRRTMTWFGFWSQASRRVYAAAGSFIHYLVESYGMERFRALWTQRDFAAVYGRDLEDLLVQWRRAKLEPIELSAAQMRHAERLFRPPAIFAVACAHEQARLSVAAARAAAQWSLAEADSLYRELIDVASGETQYRLRRVGILMRRRHFDAARSELLDVLDSPGMHGALRGDLLDRLGDASWNLGRHAEADRAYEEALEWSSSRDQTRALHISRQVLADSSLASSLREYLTDVLPNEPGLALLAQALSAHPDSPLPRYLMGRRLYFTGRFSEAAVALTDLPGDERLPTDARLASLELLANARLRSGTYGVIRPALSELSSFRLESGESMRFADIAARAAWHAKRASGSAPIR